MDNFKLFFVAPSAQHIQRYLPIIMAFITFLITSFTTDKKLARQKKSYLDHLDHFLAISSGGQM